MNRNLSIAFSIFLLVGIMVPFTSSVAETEESNEITVTVSSEKDSYLFGDIAVIEGSISEEVFIIKPFFQPEPIIVDITGCLTLSTMPLGSMSIGIIVK